MRSVLGVDRTAYSRQLQEAGVIAQLTELVKSHSTAAKAAELTAELAKSGEYCYQSKKFCYPEKFTGETYTVIYFHFASMNFRAMSIFGQFAVF